MADTDQFSDQEIMAKTLFGEARNQGEEGIKAVANVILNRMNSGITWWGDTIRNVCLHSYQFSCWNSSDPNRIRIMRVTDADKIYKLCLAVADLAMRGDLDDNTNGATSYQVIGTNAKWSQGQTPVAVIGSHEFYIV